jgi:Icc-related predicted phosphoesterase
MRIAVVSDTHGMWPSLNYPKADMLVLAGDILHNYNPDRLRDANKQLEEVAFLNTKFGMLKKDGTYNEIVIIAGNHDYCFQLKNVEAKALITNAHYLQDSEVVIDGVKFWGSPWQPWFWNWAFNFPNHNTNFLRAKAHAVKCWAQIPDDTDVLITHGPSYGMLDKAYRGHNRWSESLGCKFMADRISNLKLKSHFFGHIHGSYGQKITGGLNNDKLTYVNASACNEQYKPVNPIQVIEI